MICGTDKVGPTTLHTLMETYNVKFPPQHLSLGFLPHRITFNSNFSLPTCFCQHDKPGIAEALLGMTRDLQWWISFCAHIALLHCSFIESDAKTMTVALSISIHHGNAHKVLILGQSKSNSS